MTSKVDLHQVGSRNSLLNVLLALWVLFALLIILFTVPSLVTAADQTIVPDGQFLDWDGQAYVSDPVGDAEETGADVRAFYFRTDLNAQVNYFMVELGAEWVESNLLRLYVDTNDDGVYTHPTDRLAEVHYIPQPSSSVVNIALFDGTGKFLDGVTRGADWGASLDEEGRRVEWGLSYTQLGIMQGQVTRMRLEAISDGTVSDTVPEIQSTPADALGRPLLALLTVVGASGLAYRRRQLDD